MSQPKPSTEPAVVGAPYLDDDADIVLRSSDGVHFHVHKLLLSKCSPVFADMFSLPQPKSWGKESKGQRPVVQMAEDKHALRLLLGFCYPAGAGAFTTLSDIRIALNLTKKYQMLGTRECLTTLLLGHVRSEPEKVFAIAWIFEMKGVATAAAKQTLEKPWLEGPTPVEFDYVPASAMHKLLQYQRSCRAAALAIVSNEDIWFGREDMSSHPVLRGFHYDHCTDWAAIWEGDTSQKFISYPERWIADFQGRARSALEKKPIGAAVQAPSVQLSFLAEISDSICKDCSFRPKDIVPALEYVTGHLVAAIDAKIATVQLETPF